MTIIGEQLWIERGDGAARAHRVRPCGPVRLAIIEGRRQRATPVRLLGVAGASERYVPASELVPAEPLTRAEEAEYNRLEEQLAGTIGEARALKRFNCLRLRSLIFGAAA